MKCQKQNTFPVCRNRQDTRFLPKLTIELIHGWIAHIPYITHHTTDCWLLMSILFYESISIFHLFSDSVLRAIVRLIWRGSLLLTLQLIVIYVDVSYPQIPDLLPISLFFQTFVPLCDGSWHSNWNCCGFKGGKYAILMNKLSSKFE